MNFAARFIAVSADSHKPDCIRIPNPHFWKELPINILPQCFDCKVVDRSAGPLEPAYSALIQGEMKLILGDAAPIYDGWWSNGDYIRTNATRADSDAQAHLYNLVA